MYGNQFFGKTMQMIHSYIHENQVELQNNFFEMTNTSR